MIRSRAFTAGLIVLLSFFEQNGVFAQPDFSVRNHFHSHTADLQRVVQNQERIREQLVWREASALGPKYSWTLMMQGAGFRNPIPAVASLNVRFHTHWSAGLGWYGGPEKGLVLQADGSVGRWIVQGKMVRLIGRSEPQNSLWLAGMGLRRRQLLTPGLWLYALAEYQWRRTAAGGSLITWMGLEWLLQRPEGSFKVRFPAKRESADAARRLATAIRGWPKRGIFD